MEKILIIRFSSIGDIVLTTPVVRCLKTQLPDCTIHYVTKKTNVGLLDKNPYIDEVFAFDNNFKDLVAQLKSQGYTRVIDLHNNIRSRLLAFKLGKPVKHFKKLNIQKWLYVNLKINNMPSVHIVDRYLKTVENLGVINDKKGLDFYVGNFSETLPEFADSEAKYIAWAIGGKHNTKIFPYEKIRQICSALTHKIVLLGDKFDAERGALISADYPHVVNACGKLSLDASAQIIKDAALVITNDTGLMHIAAAYKKNIISLWGNTVPDFGMYPYVPVGIGVLTDSIEVENLKCRPCSKIGYKSCPKNHFKCMQEIKESDIIESIRGFL